GRPLLIVVGGVGVVAGNRNPHRLARRIGHRRLFLLGGFLFIFVRFFSGRFADGGGTGHRTGSGGGVGRIGGRGFFILQIAATVAAVVATEIFENEILRSE